MGTAADSGWLRGVATRLALDTRGRFGWAMYDWAHSAFTTTVLAVVFPIYYVGVAGANLSGNLASVYYGYTLAIAFLIIALLSPILGAIADHAGSARRLLGVFIAIGVVCTAALAFLEPGNWLLASALFLPAMVSYAGSLMFYNSLLPHLVEGDEMDTLSSTGYALGYIGGGLLLAVNAAWIALPETFGFGSVATAQRAAMVSVAVWWALFSIPVLRYVSDPPPQGDPDSDTGVLRAGYDRLRTTASEIRQYRHAAVFLLAFWLYNDGIASLISLAAAYGTEIGLGSGAIIGAILMVQFVAAPFALVFGWFARITSARTGIIVGLVVYSGVAVGTYFITQAWQFFALAFLVGTVMGGTQALSRSLFGSIIPTDRSSEFFSFYNVSSRFASIVGPTMFATIAAATGSTRLAMLSLTVLFVGGLVVFLGVDVDEGRRVVETSGPSSVADGAVH